MSKYSFIGVGSLFGPRVTEAWRVFDPAALVLGIIADLMQPLPPCSRTPVGSMVLLCSLPTTLGGSGRICFSDFAVESEEEGKINRHRN